MAAYIFGRIEVTDWDRYTEYMKLTPGIIEKYGGRFIARGGQMIALEGPEITERVVLVEFPTLEQAREFYDSEEYQRAREKRHAAATVSLIAIDGVD
jgi:uncharacterized protein (DUF1330 family)